jgi:hypothetical protein
MTENRDNNNLASINSQIMSGNQDMWSGMMELLKRVLLTMLIEGKGSQAEQDMASFGNNTTLDECRCFFAKFYRSATDQLFSLSKPAV